MTTATKPRRRRGKVEQGTIEKSGDDFIFIEVNPDEISVYDIAIKGATGIQGGEALQPKQTVRIEGVGQVIGVHVEQRTRRLKGGGRQSFFVRRLIVRADKIQLLAQGKL